MSSSASCKNVVWIDTVGFHYFIQKHQCGRGSVEWSRIINYLFEELSGKSFGYLVDGNRGGKKCKIGNVDIQKNRYLRSVVECLTQLLSPLPSSVWEVPRSADTCDMVCAGAHELYNAVCRCEKGEEFIVAECGCEDFMEGVKNIGGKKVAQCLIHASCPRD